MKGASMSAPSAAAAVLADTIRYHRRGVTFTQLAGALRHAGINPDGDIDTGFLDRNIYLWFGMSQEFADAVAELQAHPNISIREGAVLDYAFDGGPVFNVPLVKRWVCYKNPRWLPTLFDWYPEGRPA